MQTLLEIAVFNPGAALQAAAAGAHRIELCDNPADGGTTPSYGILKQVRKAVTIPVFPIIRPRGGDFLFTADEFAIMRDDILLCKDLGFEGVVIGALNSDGTVDQKNIQQLCALAYPMEVTFHRAFDRAKYPFEALEQIIDCGCNRILTSGQVPNAPDATTLIANLIERADDRIIIMPGSGVRSSNIAALAKATGASEFHSSARFMRTSNMTYHAVAMQEELSFADVDVAEVQNMLSALQALND